jgi:hypothetical protein
VRGSRARCAPHAGSRSELARRLGCLCTQDHEWVKVDGGIATVGITDHAQTQLGDVVYVDLPSVCARSLG